MPVTEITPFASDSFLSALANAGRCAEKLNSETSNRVTRSTVLSEICSELLMRRKSDRQPALIHERMSLDDARSVLRQAAPVPLHKMREACEALIRSSTDAIERRVASDLRAQMGEIL